MDKKKILYALVGVVALGGGVLLFSNKDKDSSEIKKDSSGSYGGGNAVNYDLESEGRKAVNVIDNVLKKMKGDGDDIDTTGSVKVDGNAPPPSKKKDKKIVKKVITKEGDKYYTTYNQDLTVNSPAYQRERAEAAKAINLVAHFSSTNVEKAVEGTTIPGFGGGSPDYVPTTTNFSSDGGADPNLSNRITQSMCRGILANLASERSHIMKQNAKWRYTYVLEKLQYISGFGSIAYSLQDAMVNEILSQFETQELDIASLCDTLSDYLLLPNYAKNKTYEQCLEVLEALIESRKYSYKSVSIALRKITGFSIIPTREKDNIINAISADLKAGSLSKEKYCSKINALIDKAISDSDIFKACMQTLNEIEASGIRESDYILKSLREKVYGFQLLELSVQKEFVSDILTDLENEGKFFAEQHCSAIASKILDTLDDFDTFRQCIKVVSDIIINRVPVLEWDKKLFTIKGFSLLSGEQREKIKSRIMEASDDRDPSVIQKICFDVASQILDALKKSSILGSCIRVVNEIMAKGRHKDEAYVLSKLSEITGFSEISSRNKEKFVKKIGTLIKGVELEQKILLICIDLSSTILNETDFNALYEECLLVLEDLAKNNTIKILTASDPNDKAKEYLDKEFILFKKLHIETQNQLASLLIRYLDKTGTKEAFCDAFMDILEDLSKNDPFFQCMSVLTALIKEEALEGVKSQSTFLYSHFRQNLNSFDKTRSDLQAKMISDFLEAYDAKSEEKVEEICTAFSDLIGRKTRITDIPPDDTGSSDKDKTDEIIAKIGGETTAEQKRAIASSVNDYSPIVTEQDDSVCRDLLLRVKLKYDFWAQQATKFNTKQLLELKQAYIDEINDSLMSGEFYIPFNKHATIQATLFDKFRATNPVSLLVNSRSNATIVARMYKEKDFILEKSVESSDLTVFLHQLAYCTHIEVDDYEWGVMVTTFQNYILGKKVGRVKIESPEEAKERIEEHYTTPQCIEAYDSLSADDDLDQITDKLGQKIDFFTEFTVSSMGLYAEKALCYLNACQSGTATSEALGECTGTEDITCDTLPNEQCHDLVSSLLASTPADEDNYSSPADFMHCEPEDLSHIEEGDFMTLLDAGSLGSAPEESYSFDDGGDGSSPPAEAAEQVSASQVQKSYIKSLWELMTQFNVHAKTVRRDIVAQLWEGIEQKYGEIIPGSQCVAIISETWDAFTAEDVDEAENSDILTAMETAVVATKKGADIMKKVLEPLSPKCKCYLDKMYDTVNDQIIENYAVCGDENRSGYSAKLKKYINEYGAINARGKACNVFMKQVSSVITDKREINVLNISGNVCHQLIDFIATQCRFNFSLYGSHDTSINRWYKVDNFYKNVDPSNQAAVKAAESAITPMDFLPTSGKLNVIEIAKYREWETRPYEFIYNLRRNSCDKMPTPLEGYLELQKYAFHSRSNGLILRKNKPHATKFMARYYTHTETSTSWVVVKKKTDKYSMKHLSFYCNEDFEINNSKAIDMIKYGYNDNGVWKIGGKDAPASEEMRNMADGIKHKVCVQKLRDIHNIIGVAKEFYWDDGEGWNKGSNCKSLSSKSIDIGYMDNSNKTLDSY